MAKCILSNTSLDQFVRYHKQKLACSEYQRGFSHCYSRKFQAFCKELFHLIFQELCVDNLLLIQ